MRLANWLGAYLRVEERFVRSHWGWEWQLDMAAIVCLLHKLAMPAAVWSMHAAQMGAPVTAV